MSGGSFIGRLNIPSIVPMELIVEASPRRVYGNAHTYHVNSISVNSDEVCDGFALLVNGSEKMDRLHFTHSLWLHEQVETRITIVSEMDRRE